MDQNLQFVIPALMGVESTVAYELKKLGLQNVRAENGRVLCSGGPADIPRVNINLRTGARLLISLGTFRARSFEELFQGTEALPCKNKCSLALCAYANQRFALAEQSAHGSLVRAQTRSSLLICASAQRVQISLQKQKRIPISGILFCCEGAIKKIFFSLLVWA